MGEVSRRTLLVGALGAAAGAAVGCAQRPADPVTPSPTPSRTATRTATPAPTADTRPRWPLTGILLADPDAARRPAVAVKVPDTRVEHPQFGVDAADIVFVELDGYRGGSEYSATRLVAVFHSAMPEAVGPVRSLRPVDVPLLSPLRAVIGHTGGAGPVVTYVESFDEYLVAELSYMATKGTGAYSIDASRVYSMNGRLHYDRAVRCHPETLASLTTRFPDGPPVPYFPFARTEAEVSTDAGRPARTVAVPWMAGDTYTMTYTWDEASGTYVRGMPWGTHVVASGARVATDNVLVIRARQRYARMDISGGEEPFHDIIDDTGPFHYAHGGRCVTGSWAKGAVDEVFRFTLDDGRPLRMAPGRTWVELARSDAPVLIG